MSRGSPMKTDDDRTHRINMIVTSQRRKNNLGAQRQLRRREELRREARCITSEIVGAYPEVSRVILFGSVTQPGRRRYRDIDLYVEGIAQEAGLRRIADRSSCPVDIVTDGWVSAAVYDQISRYGEVLYDANQ